MKFARFAIVSLVVLSLGCQAEKTTSTADGTGNSTSQPLTEVTIGLNWYPEAEHGGYYAALVHGYFKEEGLNVTIRPGGPNVPLIAEVAAGTILFGVDNADKLVLLRAQQADAVCVMSPIQNSPRCIMVHKKSALTSLDQLATAPSFTLSMNQSQPFAQYMLKKLNLKDVRVVPFAGGIGNFLEEPQFGQQAYSFSEPFLAEKQGSDPQCLMLSEIGFNTYTSVLLTNRATIDAKSDLVSKVTRASIRGWKKYLSEPAETNKFIHEQNTQMGLDILEYGARILKESCLPAGFDESQLGQMSDERWTTLISQMTEIGSIMPNSVEAKDAYTLKFLEAN